MRFLFKALLAATALIPVASAATAQQVPGDRAEGSGSERPGRDLRAERGGRDRGPDRDYDRREGGPSGRGDRPASDQQRQWADRRADGPGQQPDADRARFDPGQRDARSEYRPDDRFDRPQPRPANRGGDDRGGWNQPRPDPQRYDRRFDDGRRRDPSWQRDRQPDRGIWNRTWRDDRRYDWGRYRTDNRSAYRLPRYYAPRDWNYGYRRFSIGVTLNSPLWAERYWIEDPYAYRLPEAYGPYRWVRYYDDALLVDVRSGRVVDVVYAIFW